MILLDMMTITEGVSMEQEKSEHIQGRPWKVEAKFKTYEEAASFKNEMKKAENPPEEIKIKFMSSADLFVVKVRKKEEQNKSKKSKSKK